VGPNNGCMEFGGPYASRGCRAPGRANAGKVCLYIYIYMCVCVCVCMCMYILCMYVCIYILYMYVCMYVYMIAMMLRCAWTITLGTSAVIHVYLCSHGLKDDDFLRKLPWLVSPGLRRLARGGCKEYQGGRGKGQLRNGYVRIWGVGGI